MINERERASELVGIITETEPRYKTHIELIGPISGDGHSFDDSYEKEEVVDKKWYVPKNSSSDMMKARKELKTIYQNTNDVEVRTICEEGIKHEHVTFGLPEYVALGITLSIAGGIGYGIYLAITN